MPRRRRSRRLRVGRGLSPPVKVHLTVKEERAFITRQGEEPATLVVRFQGEAVQNHRLPLSDLVDFGRQLETAVHRVALVLLGNSNSVHPGRRHADIERAVALEVVAMVPGSFELHLEQAPQASNTLFNLGAEALSALVAGFPEVQSQGAPLPRGYDRGVLLAVKAAGRRLGQGIDAIEIGYRAEETSFEASYSLLTQQIITHRLKQKTIELRTIDGQLLMGDFQPTSLRCRIHPPLVRPIVGTFTRELQPRVLDALTRYVRVTGETLESEGVITSMHIHDVRVLGSAEPYLPAIKAGEQLSAGWEDVVGVAEHQPAIPRLQGAFPRLQTGIDERTDIYRLIEMQGIGPVQSAHALRGGYWPDEDEAENFDETVRGWRHEGEGEH